MRLLTAGDDDRPDRVLDTRLAAAAAGLASAVAGQLAHSSSGRLWELSRWHQLGAWWELLVTTSICAAALIRRTRPAVTAAAVVALSAAAATAQELEAVLSRQDDPAVSTTVTLLGFGLLAVVLTAALVGSLRHR
jgi:hypothetical protein